MKRRNMLARGVVVSACLLMGAGSRADEPQRTSGGLQLHCPGSGTAKVQVPSQMLPPLTSVHDDHRVEIHDLKLSDKEIKGPLSFNFANKPKLRIDRVTGEISITGGGASFQGDCRAADANTRQF